MKSIFEKPLSFFINSVRRIVGRRYILQYRPDSDIVHGHLTPPAEILADWPRGLRRNNLGDFTRLYFLYQNLRALDAAGVPGAMAELGVWKGNSAHLLHKTSPERKLYLFDTFTGFDRRDVSAESGPLPVEDDAFCDTSLAAVEARLGHSSRVTCCQGWFPETASQLPEDERFCLVHVDCDLGRPVTAALEYFYPKMSAGGVFIIHDYSSGWWPDVKPAVDAFMADKPEGLVLIPDKSGTAVFVRQKI